MWEEIQSFFESMYEGSAFEDGVNTLSEWGQIAYDVDQQIGDNISNWWEGVMNDDRSLIEQYWDFAVDTVSDVAEGTGEWFQDRLDGSIEFINGINESLMSGELRNFFKSKLVDILLAGTPFSASHIWNKIWLELAGYPILSGDNPFEEAPGGGTGSGIGAGSGTPIDDPSYYSCEGVKQRARSAIASGSALIKGKVSASLSKQMGAHAAWH